MRMIDQIRASKLPSNMMQFAARGALQVTPGENIEILVHLARHNKVFGDLARMTLAGWDPKTSLAAASDPNTPTEVLEYFISPDNLRPHLLPALLENPAVSEGQLVKFALSAMRESIDVMLKSQRVRSLTGVLEALRSNPYLKKEEAEELRKTENAVEAAEAAAEKSDAVSASEAGAPDVSAAESAELSDSESAVEPGDPADDEHISVYMKEHADDIAAEAGKAFHAIGGVQLLGDDSDAVEQVVETPAPATAASTPEDAPKSAVAAKPAAPKPPAAPKRENALQKINSLDVKGRIQLALKGNKEERSLLIRDGTKVVALAVLEAPKLSDGEVEKFASQKNVLESVLRQIPLKRRFLKNYKVVRNLVANPRTPLDLGLGLMKNLLTADLKNLSANKEVSETIRKLALKMYKQKMETANKK